MSQQRTVDDLERYLSACAASASPVRMLTAADPAHLVTLQHAGETVVHLAAELPLDAGTRQRLTVAVAAAVEELLRQRDRDQYGAVMALGDTLSKQVADDTAAMVAELADRTAAWRERSAALRRRAERREG